MAGVLALILVAGGIFVWARTRHPLANGSSRPTILFILVDDERWDSMGVLPNVQRLITNHGVAFTNSFVVDPLCCPSRAANLTGQYPHSTGVWTNSGPHGGFQAFHDRSTIATWLHDRGYTTALFGKYLNRYQNTTYIPPGWDHWEAFDGSATTGAFYFNYTMNIQGTLHHYGTAPSEYSTDVLAKDAASFIRSTDGPLFVYFSTSAPHAPAVPAPQDVGAYRNLKPWRPASYNEQDLSREPAWVRSLRPLGPGATKKIDRLREHMLESLRAVDRAVQTLMNALADTGRLGHTMIVFTSDNGFSWGEHRWHSKIAPWDEDIRVPLVIRYDPLTRTPSTDSRLVANIDLTSTFAALAGAEAPGSEGRSLLPLLAGHTTPWRKDLLIESLQGELVPSYCELRTPRYAFIDYTTGESELYDVRKDPLELANLSSRSTYRSKIRTFNKRLRTLCRPPPPGSPAGFPP